MCESACAKMKIKNERQKANAHKIDCQSTAPFFSEQNFHVSFILSQCILSKNV